MSFNKVVKSKPNISWKFVSLKGKPKFSIITPRPKTSYDSGEVCRLDTQIVSLHEIRRRMPSKRKTSKPTNLVTTWISTLLPSST